MRIFYKRNDMKGQALRLSLALLLTGGTFLSSNADSFKILPGPANGISPDGKTVVGNKLSYSDNNLFISYVYSTESGESVWVTDYQPDNLLKSGLFNAVTNSGIKVGAVKNPNLRLPESSGGDDFFRPAKAESENTGEALTSAAVWRDGKLYVLDIPGWNTDLFEDSFDGSYATGVTEDGLIVVGYIRQAWYIQTPCYWIYNSETDSYDFGMFPLGENCPVGAPSSFSPEAAVLVGTVSYLEGDGATVYANMWEGPEMTEILELPAIQTPYYNTAATAISQNGRYVGVTGNGPNSYAGIFDRITRTYTRIPVPDSAISVSVEAIADDGSTFVRYDVEGTVTLNYFDYLSGTFVDIKYYLSDVAPEIVSQILPDAYITSVSGDGKTIIGRNGSSSWVITIDNPRLLTVSAPDQLSFVHTDPYTVRLAWKGISQLPEGTKLIGYKAVIDGNAKEYECAETGGEFEYVVNVQGRYHSAYIQSIFEKKSEQFLSPRSETLTSGASAVHDAKMFEDFDNASSLGEQNFTLNNDYWDVEADGLGMNELIRWHLSLDDFDNRSLVMQMYAVSSQPWSCRLLSRFFDAPSDNSDVNFSMRYKRRAVSLAGQNFSTDWLDIEVTKDGENWTKVKRINGETATEGMWNSVYFTIPREVLGDIYRIRINANGLGKTQLLWLIDDVAVGQSETDETATGLKFISFDENEGLKLAWHNELGLHQLSYLENSPIVWDYNVGNEGKPMLVAVDVKDNLTAPYYGEYITGISSFLFDDPEISVSNPTRAEGILYEDGIEVARATIYSEFNDVASSVAWFSTPVEIKKGKVYRAAVRISDYPAEQAPLYYQAGLSMIPGVTDLYSEDEGKTWNKASAVLDDGLGKGNVIWPIRLLISETPEVDNSLEFQSWVNYNVLYRDGEPVSDINYYEPYPYGVDLEPRYKAEYQLRTFYADGSASELSEPLMIDLTNVEEVFDSIEGEFTYDKALNKITSSAEVTSLVLTALDGSAAAVSQSGEINTTGLKGLYVLTLKTAKGNKSYKLIL